MTAPARFLGLIAGLGMLATAAAGQDLVALARPGPWPAVSGLIGFDGRLWLVNSALYRNHNAADIYSYDPVRGTTRYEAALFSQGAGDPVVFEGRLYWPFEDPRLSALRGETMVTDGRAWRWRAFADGEAFHVHAMAAMNGRLYAATSAWRAGLQVSDDGGATWRVIYDHPTPEDRVSRITALAVAHGTLYAGLTDRRETGPRLLRLQGGTLAPVAGWPEGHRVSVLAGYRDWLYGNIVTADGASLWRTDGARVERVAALDGRVVRGLGAGAGALWAVSASAGQGRLWRSVDGVAWDVAQDFDDAMPVSVAVHGGEVYVGTMGPRGRGTLWGPPPPRPAEPSLARPLTPRAAAPEADFSGPLADLDRALADADSYADFGAGLRHALGAFAGNRTPALGAALSERLAGPFPDLRVQLFAEEFVVTATAMAQWGLLRAIALTGHGFVPPNLIATPWRAAVNDAEKYFEPAPAAAWAAAQLGQDDAATLAALIARLDGAGDPDWLAGDMIGALTALTGQRFGHDVAAWQSWWSEARRRD